MIAAAVMASIWFEPCRPRVGGTGSANARDNFFSGRSSHFPVELRNDIERMVRAAPWPMRLKLSP